MCLGGRLASCASLRARHPVPPGPAGLGAIMDDLWAWWTTPKIGASPFEASPTAADGKVYLINFDGEVTIVNADDGAILNSIPMESDRTKDFVRSSIVVSNGQLLVRTNSSLFCIGK